MVLAIFVNLVTLANLANLVMTIFVNLVNLVNLANLLILVIAIFANLVNLVNLANLVLAICVNFDMSYYLKNNKIFHKTKIFMKISIVFKNLFQSVREKIKIEKVVHEKFKSNVLNKKKISCVRKDFKLCKKLNVVKKNLSCIRKKIS